MNIYVACNLPKKDLLKIKKISKKNKVFYNDKTEKQKIPDKNFLQSEIVFGNIPPHWITESKKLKWIQLESVGFGEYLGLDWKKLKNKITITNLKGFFCEPVSETILSGILSFYRGIDRFIILKNNKKWIGDPIRNELELLINKKVLFFGYGTINRRLHNILKPFQCYFDIIDINTKLSYIEDKIKIADIIVCASPETKKTINFFDKKKLKLLKKESLFINAGRGSLIDEKELIKILKNKKIKGAVLDVTRNEPLKSSDPLWTCPNLILTQHTAGGSIKETLNKVNFFEDNFKRFCLNKPLKNIINLSQGF